LSEPILCPARTYPATRDSPAEHCENEVEDYGDLCAVHDEDDRADELYEQYLESKYEETDHYPWGNDE